jgi:hypothetical protein
MVLSLHREWGEQFDGPGLFLNQDGVQIHHHFWYDIRERVLLPYINVRPFFPFIGFRVFVVPLLGYWTFLTDLFGQSVIIIPFSNIVTVLLLWVGKYANSIKIP